MKKYFLFLLAVAVLDANSQQLSNTTFDAEWVDCFPWEAGSYVSSPRGTQPDGWCISNVSQNALPVVGEEVTPDANGTGKAVRLTNVKASIGDNTAPGYITLGTAWATAETKLTNVQNADGGVFGGIAFTCHPDALRLTYKCDRSEGEENMSVIAYLWKGTWTQQDVPSNTAIGFTKWGVATKVTMTDRLNNILGRETLTGGNVTHTDDAALIASAEYFSSAAIDEWTTREIPLNYGEYAGQSVSVEKLNIVIASNGLFDGRNTIKAGNSVTVDNVELVYYHALSALSYEGALVDFSEEVTTYDLSSYVYDESKLNYTVKGQAASVSSTYDDETAVLTIRVEGEDIAVNSSSFTEYKIQFKKEGTVEKLVPMVTAGKTDLLVEECASLILENCDGLTAEYSVPGIISYADGVVTALAEGIVTLILTQPSTETIEAGTFEIEFSVSRHEAAWTWNVEPRYYYPNTVIENVFQVTSGDTSLFTFASSNPNIAKVSNGNLVIGEQTGVAFITVRCRGNVKWKPSEQQYEVMVGAPGHVPFSLTQDLYKSMTESISGGEGWDANGGIRLGNNIQIFSWGDKSFVMEITGIPDKLTFSYSSSSGASSRQYAIYESADGEEFTEIWRDNRGSGVDGNSYWCNDLQLSPDTRFIKFFYYGNCAAYYREISVTELHKFESDTEEIVLNEVSNTGSFVFTHANANEGVITVTAPRAITVSVPQMVGGMDIYGKQVVEISYDVDECDVDDDIVITDGIHTETVHVIARLEDPTRIRGLKAETECEDIFNLSGQRISKLQKGINIVGGRKVFVK